MHRGGPRAPVRQGHRGHREGVHRRLQVVEVEMDMDNLVVDNAPVVDSHAGEDNVQVVVDNLLVVGKDNRAPADNAPDAADRDVDSLVEAYEDRLLALPHLEPLQVETARVAAAQHLGVQPVQDMDVPDVPDAPAAGQAALVPGEQRRLHVFAAILRAPEVESKSTPPSPHCSNTSLVHICSLAMAALDI